MKFLAKLRGGSRRHLRQFHVFISRHPEEPTLYRTRLSTDIEGFMLAAMCNEDDVAVAVLAKIPVDDKVTEGGVLTRPALLADAQRAAATWSGTLGVVLDCDPPRIEWVVVESRESAFAATKAFAEGPWVPLEDLSERGRSSWDQFTDVYPEFVGLARGRLTTWMRAPEPRSGPRAPDA